MEAITKQQLREKYWNLRKELKQDKIEKFNRSINRFIQKKQIKNVHVFLPIKENIEVNIWPFIQSLVDKGTTIGTTIWFGNNNMKHVIIDKSTTFKKGKFNIPVPTSYETADLGVFEVILVPLLAFDQFGNRVGYGKGIYDRILNDCSSNCTKIGVSFFKAESSLPTNNHDVALDSCITPYGEIDFNS